MDGQEQAKQLRQRLMVKVESVSKTGCQGNLGLTADAHERTPAQAVALLTRELVAEKRRLDRFATTLSKKISQN